ncbi:MAG: 50S ribosomal protein L21 [candidate division WOR-3 bacterium]
MYAVVEFAGAQFIATPGEKVTIPKIKANIGEIIKIPNVLFIKTDDQTLIGKPTIANAFVEAKVLANIKSKKVTVFKFIRRENYRRKKGHRQPLSELEILKINLPQ